jgi:GT2 family glycosyltransferase
MGSVSAVIPNWNGRHLLIPLLESLGRQSVPVEEVIVVDNGSEDDSAAVAEARGARVIRMGRNCGYAGAVNRGVSASTKPWILILNNDVVLEERWLERMLARLREAGAWFGVGKIYQAGERSRLDATFDLLARSGCAWRCGQGRLEEYELLPEGSAWLPPLTAALFLREIFNRVGLLDERFESYLEDVDFGLRCVLAGIPGCYVPEAVAWHRGSATLGLYHPETVRRMARNQLFLVAKHYPSGWWRRLGWPVLVGQLLWALVAVRHGQGISYLKGKWEGLRRFGDIRGSAEPGEAIVEFLAASERQLRRWQRRTGYDFYWRLYFALT